MRISWGTSIVIAFTLFMSFILYFVFKVQGNPKYDNELVVEDYYKNDAKFGNEMTLIEQTNKLTDKPVIKAEQGEIMIVFPASYDVRKINGKVSLYRPSDKKMDFDVPISMSNPTLLIPKKSLAGGRWDITLKWNYDGVAYQMNEKIYLNP